MISIEYWALLINVLILSTVIHRNDDSSTDCCVRYYVNGVTQNFSFIYLGLLSKHFVVFSWMCIGDQQSLWCYCLTAMDIVGSNSKGLQPGSNIGTKYLSPTFQSDRRAICTRPKQMLGFHFYPKPVLAFGYWHCLRLRICPCVCVYHSLACPYDNSSAVQARVAKFGTEVQNTLFNIPIILGMINLDIQDQNSFKSRILLHFELVRTITCHPVKPESPNLDQKCILVQLRSLLILGVIKHQL